jgi:hypothetical protein
MATRTKFARLSQYWCKFSKASHIFLKNGLWQMLASLASPAKLLGECWQIWQIYKLGHFMQKNIFLGIK